MQASLSFKTFIAAGISLLVISCNSNKKEKTKITEVTLRDIKQEEKNIEPPPPPPPKVLPPKIEMKKEICFENTGLKYRLRIRINFISAKRATVSVSSNEIGGNKISVANFSCDVNVNNLIIKSVEDLPAAGDASEWVANKNWVIDTANGKTVLSVPFNAKNYDTNKWELTDYEFVQVECK
ncbi:MAG: hypothetical protein HZB42_04095 [Sphingobacteriales bacterium]|nr:hypothetical protein [Sphingobacteriales bacterium]